MKSKLLLQLIETRLILNDAPFIVEIMIFLPLLPMYCANNLYINNSIHFFYLWNTGLNTASFHSPSPHLPPKTATKVIAFISHKKWLH